VSDPGTPRPPICTLKLSSLRRTMFARCATDAGMSSRCEYLSDREHTASHGLIWPKDGFASIAWAAMASARLSSPGLRPFLASQESPSATILRCAPARTWVRRRSPSACRSPSRPRWSRARTAKEKRHG